MRTLIEATVCSGEKEQFCSREKEQFCYFTWNMQIKLSKRETVPNIFHSEQTIFFKFLDKPFASQWLIQ